MTVGMECTNCKRKQFLSQPFQEIIVKPRESIPIALQDYFIPETILYYTCEGCEHWETTSRTLSLEAFPNTLCIIVNRHKNDGSKDNSPLAISPLLDMSKFTNYDGKERRTIYTFSSFICQTGESSQSGHYYFVLNNASTNPVLINDEEISYTSIDSHVSYVYILFYELSHQAPFQIASLNFVEQKHTLKMERFQLVKEKVKSSDTDSQVKQLIDTFLSENTDVFHLKGDKLTCCDLLEHRIPLYSDSKPVNVRPYTRRSKFEKEEIEKKVKELQDLRVIEPCRSPYNNTLHLVKKGIDENGKPKTRICLDFRALNEISIPEVYPVVQVIDILDQLAGRKY